MKLQEQKQNVMKSSGVKEKHHYTVAATSKIMRMLSDDLYSDKISAVLRELATNAKDAHIEAGKPNVAFDIHLPTKGEPWFSIRDYGNGMSKEKLMKLYTSYGSSDKDDSNDMIGAWGLGSKSPLCYTNTFTVINIHNGVKYTCVITREDDGIPSLNLLDESKTAEKSGLQIRINCRLGYNEVQEWQDKAKFIYEWFETKPNINVDIKYPARNWLFEDSNGNFTGVYSYYSNSFAIMGNILYPIDSNQVPGCSDILNYGAYLFFDIGEVQMDIGREKLQYNKTTIQNIQNKCAKFRKIIQDHVEKEIANCSSKFEAMQIYNGYSGALKNFTWTYNNESIEGSISANKFSRLYSFNNSVKDKISWKLVPIKGEKYIFVDQDIAAGSHLRCTELSKQNPNVRVLLLSKDSLQSSEDRIDFYVKTLGIKKSDVILVSSLPKPERKKSVNSKASRSIFVFDYDTNKSYSKSSDHWDHVPEDFDIDDGGYYIVIDQFCVTMNGKHMSPTQFYNFIQKFKCLGLKMPEFVAVKKAKEQKFKDHDSWRPLEDRLKEILLKNIDKLNIKKKYGICTNYNNLEWNFARKISELRLLGLTSNNKIQKLIKLYDYYSKVNNKYGSVLKDYMFVGDYLGVKDTVYNDGNGSNSNSNNKKGIYDLNKMMSSIRNSYSILKYVNIDKENFVLVARIIHELGEH